MGIDGSTNNHTQRNTDVRFAPEGYWFANFMLGIGHKANKTCRWGFDLTGNENIQYAEYGPDQHYDWHMDTFLLSEQMTDRKVTVVCLLSDTEDFTGGAFEIRHEGEYTAPLVKGSLIAFPSFLYHRVTPVITGTRKTATMWLNGPKLK